MCSGRTVVKATPRHEAQRSDSLGDFGGEGVTMLIMRYQTPRGTIGWRPKSEELGVLANMREVVNSDVKCYLLFTHVMNRVDGTFLFAIR